MSQAAGQQPEEADSILSGGTKAAIEAKRDTLERVSSSDYPVAEYAKTLLKVVDTN